MTSPYRGGAPPTVETPRVPVRWVPREPPLEPAAVVGMGPSFVALLARLDRASNEALSKLRGVAGADVIVVAGEALALPWVDGAHWLGRDPAAPSLLVPTGLRPSVEVSLFERALLRGAHGPSPLAVVPRGGALVVLSMAEARPVSREALKRLREGAPS
jgi:MoxR-vWA-beta-propeller ternary system domain bpX5